MMRTYLPFLALAGLVGLPGCTAGTPQGNAQPLSAEIQPLSAEILFKHSQCGIASRAPTAVWIDNPRVLERKATGFTSSTVAKEDDLDQLAFVQGDALRAALNQVDFAKDGILLIGMGQQPTAGYGLELQSGLTSLQGNTLQVTVSWNQPTPGYSVTPMRTSPCVLLKLPAVAFRKIQVLDQKGEVRIATTR